MDHANVIRFEAEWSRIQIVIRYEANWLNTDCFMAAHIQVESVVPMREPLPITETGYRSHFTSPEVIEDHGGPVAFVLAWLDAESQSPAWKQAEAARRQLSLF